MLPSCYGFRGGSVVKNPPAMQETDQSLGGKDPLEKEMATQSSSLAWEIPWTGEPGGLQSMGTQFSTKQQQQELWNSCNKDEYFILNLL